MAKRRSKVTVEAAVAPAETTTEIAVEAAVGVAAAASTETATEVTAAPMAWTFQAQVEKGQITQLLDLVQTPAGDSSVSIQTNLSELKMLKEGNLLVQIKSLPDYSNYIFFVRSRERPSDRWAYLYAKPAEGTREIKLWCSAGAVLNFYAGDIFGRSFSLSLDLELNP